MTAHHDHHHHHPHPGGKAPAAISRRRFLQRSSEIAIGTAIAVTAGGTLLNSAEAWATEVKALKPETLRTLIAVARDIYPHDRIADRFYAIAVKSHDDTAATDESHKALIETGIATLDTAAGAGGYLGMQWEADRVALLRTIDDTAFFQAVRGGLVVGLYNQPDVWTIFGYEGESYSKGGYIDRGFDDIDWI